MKNLVKAAFVGAFFCVSGAAQSAVVGGGITGGSTVGQGGVFVELDPNSTFTVGNNNFQDPNLYAFDEGQNILLGSDVTLEIGGTLSAGTEVASHYVFFDPRFSRSVQGYVEFDAEVLGIATATDTLLATDSLLNNNVTYLNPTLRGLESGDTAGIDPLNPFRILVDFTARTPGDYVRVLTSQSPSSPPAVPLPAGGVLILSALGALAAFRRKA